MPARGRYSPPSHGSPVIRPPALTLSASSARTSRSSSCSSACFVSFASSIGWSISLFGLLSPGVCVVGGAIFGATETIVKMCASSAPFDALVGALRDVRTRVRRVPDTVVDALAAHIGVGSQVSIDDALVTFIGGDQCRRDAVVEIAGAVARHLANGDDPPFAPESLVVWHSLVRVVDALVGSGVCAIGRPSFVSDHLLDALRREAMDSTPEAEVSSGRVAWAGGATLARLAVSRQLRDELTRALGAAVAPAHDAIYEFDPPGSHVRPHVDGRHYPIVFHLVVHHDPVDAARCTRGRHSAMTTTACWRRSGSRVTSS